MSRSRNVAAQTATAAKPDTFLLGIERQRQLLGIEGSDCGQPLDVEGLLDDCAPKWFGTLTYSLRGSYSTNRSNAAATDLVRRSLEYKFEAVVESVEEQIAGDALAQAVPS